MLPETTEAFTSRLDQLITEIPDPNVIADGLSQLVTAVDMPVNLAEGSVSSLSSAIAGETLTVDGKVDVGKPRVAGIDETVEVKGRVTADLNTGQVLNVRITNTEDLITQIDDTRSTAPAGDFDETFAG